MNDQEKVVLPFSRDQFFQIFVDYNLAIWPAQIIAYLLGGLCILLILAPGRFSSRVISSVLAFMWIWTGIAYHWSFFAPINMAAYLFAALFVVQGLYFVAEGVLREKLSFAFGVNKASVVGIAFITYAAVIYPLIGIALGHRISEIPMFGVTPCPVTIFTFGVLLTSTQRISRPLLVIPLVWSLIGGSAAILLGVPQDWVLLISGAISLVLLIIRDASEFRQTVRNY